MPDQLQIRRFCVRWHTIVIAARARGLRIRRSGGRRRGAPWRRARADRPQDGLAGVTPLQARLRTQVLTEAGRAEDAIAIAQAAVRAAGGDADGSARMQASGVCLAAVSLWLAAYGKFHYNATIRELDKRAGQLKAQAIKTAGNDREKILDIARRAATDGADPVQYDRLVRQVADIAGILGGPWRELESFMTAADTPGSTELLLLAHADFTKFTAYLENSAADPRLSPVQTAFTRHAGAGYHYPARWPPGRRYPCWCGSHRKYPRCCGSQPTRQR
jgi:hypothetical protein